MVSAAAFTMIGGLFGAGLMLVAAGSRRSFAPPWAATGREDGTAGKRRIPGRIGNGRSLAVAGAVGVMAFAVTRWPMSVPLAAIAVLAGRRIGGLPSGPANERLEAIASWTEMLADTLAGAAGLTQALVVSAPISPKALRPQLSRFAARLNAGARLVPALAELGEDICDPAADLVVAALVMAATEKAPRLSELLSALAQSTREEVAMRLEVEASRASARTAVRMIAGFSFGLFASMAVFARGYLAPYHSEVGQLVLGAVGCLFGGGLFLMSVMMRPRSFARLRIAQLGPP